MEAGLRERQLADLKPKRNLARTKLMEHAASCTMSDSLAATDGATREEQLKGSRLILTLKEMLLFLGC